VSVECADSDSGVVRQRDDKCCVVDLEEAEAGDVLGEVCDVVDEHVDAVVEVWRVRQGVYP
jgi:hypothetical protein